MEIIDAWIQHPSAEFLADPVFDSLRRWAHGGNAERVFGLPPAPSTAPGQQDTGREGARP